LFTAPWLTFLWAQRATVRAPHEPRAPRGATSSPIYTYIHIPILIFDGPFQLSFLTNDDD
jgi:hypothetical protein